MATVVLNEEQEWYTFTEVVSELVGDWGEYSWFSETSDELGSKWHSGNGSHMAGWSGDFSPNPNFQARLQEAGHGGTTGGLIRAQRFSFSFDNQADGNITIRLHAEDSANGYASLGYVDTVSNASSFYATFTTGLLEFSSTVPIEDVTWRIEIIAPTVSVGRWGMNNLQVWSVHAQPLEMAAEGHLDQVVSNVGPAPGGALPPVTVEVGLGQSIAGTSPDSITWTDITSDVLANPGVRASLGRLTDGSGPSGGTLALKMDNSSGAYTPGVAGWQVRCPLRISWNGHAVWAGFITDIRWLAEGGFPRVEVQATDAIGRLSRVQSTGRAGLYRETQVQAESLATIKALTVLSLDDADSGDPATQRFTALEGAEGRLVHNHVDGSKGVYTCQVEQTLDGGGSFSMVPDGDDHYFPEVLLPPPTTEQDFTWATLGLELTSALAEPGIYYVMQWDRARGSRSADDTFIFNRLLDPGAGSGPHAWDILTWDWMGQVLLDTTEKGLLRFYVMGTVNWASNSAVNTEIWRSALGLYEVPYQAKGDANWITLTLGQALKPSAEFGWTPSPRLWINGEEASNTVDRGPVTAALEWGTNFTGHLATPNETPRDYLERWTWEMQVAPHGNIKHDPRGTRYRIGYGDWGRALSAGTTGSAPWSGAAYSDLYKNIPATDADWAAIKQWTGQVAWFAVYSQETALQGQGDADAPERTGQLLHSDSAVKRAEALSSLGGASGWVQVDSDTEATVAAQDLTGDLATLLAEVAVVERGSLLVKPEGHVRLQSNKGRRRPVPVLTLDATSNVLALQGAFSQSDTRAADRAVVTMQPTGDTVEKTRQGVTTTVMDTISQAMVTDSKTWAESFAHELANAQGDLDTQAPSLSVSLSQAHAQGWAGQVLGLRLGDRIQVGGLSSVAPGSDPVLPLTIEAVSHEITANDWVVTLDCSPAATSGGAGVGDLVADDLEVR